MKVLFLVPYPSEGASNRIRVEQFIPYLRSQGVRARVRPFMNRPFFRILYLPGRHLAKAFWFLVCTVNRLCDIVRAVRYDIVFIHREAYPFGGPFIESLLDRLGKPIVFDFDDAIYLPNTSRQNAHIDRFKDPGKVAKIIRMSRYVIVGNEYLKAFALQYNANVVEIPSCVDTEKYRPAAPAKEAREKVVIGWMGSFTTKDYLPALNSIILTLSKRYRHVVFRVVGADVGGACPGAVACKKWALDEEAADLHDFDIGIMPVADNAWAKGKCGFKAILYMACGLPVVASAVGVNARIIDDGVSGFLAATDADWVEKLSILIDDAKLRKAMGAKGRQTVVGRYSIDYAAPLLHQTLKKAAG